jgi:hypothetical protein
MEHQTGNTRVYPQQRQALTECSWNTMSEPGAYVEAGTGDLYRVPKEALIAGGSPVIHKESRGGSRLIMISRDPLVTTLQARLTCAEQNITPNF